MNHTPLCEHSDCGAKATLWPGRHNVKLPSCAKHAFRLRTWRYEGAPAKTKKVKIGTPSQ